MAVRSLQPRITTAYLGLRTQTDRQATRALNTNSAEWKRIRKMILVRDHYRCKGWPAGKHAPDCDGIANEVDHIDGDSSNDAKDGSNYQSLSKQCHSTKTATETTQR